MELEALFGGSPQCPVDKPAPTVIVRRKRLVAMGEGAAPERGIAAPEGAGPTTERSARVFVRSKTEARAAALAAPVEVVCAPTQQATTRPAVEATVAEEARRGRRRRPEFMKPGEVVVIRPEPMRAHVEDMLPAEMASARDAAIAEAVQLETDGVDEGSAPTFVFDLEINSRWATVDKALANLRASLPKPHTRLRPPEKRHKPVRR
jgi:hypothetical protein